MRRKTSPNAPRRGSLAPARLYLHVPFCSIKCFYCDFTAFSGQGRSIARYLKALESEWNLHPGMDFSTLYIGGGTPSELSAGQLNELMEMVRRRAPGGFQEATCEANPESLTLEKLKVLRQAGATRLSLGLQTTNDGLLKAIGRRHSFKEFRSIYRAARRLGGLALSIDLMYGLPGQSPESHEKSLDDVLALEPEHVSLYGLQVEDRTLFAKREVEPDEDLGRRMFESSIERLRRAGYHHYEISNFARPGFESVHNAIYWNNGEYLGLGCGAASYLDGERSVNADRLPDYLRLAESGRNPAASMERLTGREKLGEQAFLGLRLVDGFKRAPELKSAFAAEWRRLSDQGLVELKGPLARLTQDGLFVANQVFQNFVAPFTT